jgi:hypothetical protein
VAASSSQDANLMFLSRTFFVGCYSIIVSVATSGSGDTEENWWLTSVYGPQEDADKVLFLEELEAIKDACPGPWLTSLK